MESLRKLANVLFLCIFGVAAAQAQHIIPATGGNGTGSGGTVSFTVGQITYMTLPGTNTTIAQGVQQPYEISTVTAIEKTEDISLEYYVYPNPTQGVIRLVIGSSVQDNLRCELYDLNGKIILNKPVTDKQTEIFLKSYPAAIYFLRVTRNNTEVIVFKIIKR